MTSAEAVSARVATSDDDDMFAGSDNIVGGIESIAFAAPILLRQEFHREMNPFEPAPGNVQVAWVFRSARENDGVIAASKFFH